jgi:cytochrome b subunit of formate dehydrogenase
MSGDKLVIICGFLIILLIFFSGIVIGKFIREDEIRENAYQVELISPLVVE